jgi:hypothetical protein
VVGVVEDHSRRRDGRPSEHLDGVAAEGPARGPRPRSARDWRQQPPLTRPRTRNRRFRHTVRRSRPRRRPACGRGGCPPPGSTPSGSRQRPASARRAALFSSESPSIDSQTARWRGTRDRGKSSNSPGGSRKNASTSIRG